jgi:prepilin-type processing-associated H-X9-DG protein
MEENARFETLQAVPSPWQPGYAILGEWLSVILCPSDTHQIKTTNSDGRVLTYGNIVISHGDGAHSLESNQTDKTIGDISSRGLFYYNVTRSMEYITDGTSNTIVISESVTPETSDSNFIRGGVALLSALDSGGWWWEPTLCKNIQNGNTFTGTVYTTEKRCSRYTDGTHLYTGFNLILPPNSPTCVLNTGEHTSGLYPPNSYHSGGVNCGRADGSVAFVTDSVDTNGLPKHRQGNYLNGQSPFGVWGAMGTPNGGESVGIN